MNITTVRRVRTKTKYLEKLNVERNEWNSFVRKFCAKFIFGEKIFRL